MSRDLDLAIVAAKKAGAIIRESFGTTAIITKKGLNSFATKIDENAEKVIIDHLKVTGYSFLGEETGEIDNGHSKKWVIDPLDGTTNFIKGIPFFAVSIALLANNDHLILGVIYDPIADECYWAELGHGAYMNGIEIKASPNDAFDGSIIFMSHGRSQQSKTAYVDILKSLLLDSKAHLTRQGSTALMLCYVAKARGEAFLGCGDELYDYAAGLIIASESGAIVTDWSGKTWRNNTAYIMACAPKIADKILKCASKIQSDISVGSIDRLG